MIDETREAFAPEGWYLPDGTADVVGEFSDFLQEIGFRSHELLDGGRFEESQQATFMLKDMIMAAPVALIREVVLCMAAEIGELAKDWFDNDETDPDPADGAALITRYNMLSAPADVAVEIKEADNA